MPTIDRPTRIGMIVPSSNTCLEPQTYRILGDRRDVTIHSTRIPVTRIALDDSSDKQFDSTVMRAAAELLATANVDVIAWNGTSGSWLGAAHDHAMVQEITEATGIPATTSTLAYLSAFEEFGTERIGLFTPYTSDVNDAVIASYAREGIKTIDHRHLDLSDNESFARVTDSEMLPGSLELAAAQPDALVYLCTNLYGANITAEVEARTGVPVLDSVAVTLWHALSWRAHPCWTPSGGGCWGSFAAVPWTGSCRIASRARRRANICPPFAFFPRGTHVRKHSLQRARNRWQQQRTRAAIRGSGSRRGRTGCSRLAS
ncbi:aspartate/glutamate racemase family protein [Paenarthrobacter sp. NPDC089714]|uniref:maleate cis-trans isomerase family protein n=1 Tax=Paenarthrobacter sp. NPDC089714 TaxID=3364377 RepID=UPI003806959E